MQYRIAPLYVRPWTLNGISARLIESHYEHIYGSALSRLNTVTEELKLLDIRATPARVISPEARADNAPQFDAAPRALFREPWRRWARSD